MDLRAVVWVLLEAGADFGAMVTRKLGGRVGGVRLRSRVCEITGKSVYVAISGERKEDVSVRRGSGAGSLREGGIVLFGNPVATHRQMVAAKAGNGRV